MKCPRSTAASSSGVNVSDSSILASTVGSGARDGVGIAEGRGTPAPAVAAGAGAAGGETTDGAGYFLVTFTASDAAFELLPPIIKRRSRGASD